MDKIIQKEAETMREKEKVIKGLECCLAATKCDICPYNDDNELWCGNNNALLEDALTLLKAQEPEAVDVPKPDSDIGCWYDITHNYTLEQVVSALKAQEPRLMTLEEVAALPDGSILWLEDNDKPDVIAGLLRYVLLTANGHTVVAINFATVRNQLLEVVTAMANDYGIRWRCWTSQPTEGQRKAVKWE